MFVNNEIGVIQPIKEIGNLCKKYNSFFHTDAAQAAGKLDIDVHAMNIDALSISGHKLYGPKGIGILYVSTDARLKMQPLFDGGGQEKELRSGTLPTPLCIGIGEAVALGYREKDKINATILSLRNELVSQLTQSIEGLHINGSMDKRIHGNINLSIPGIEAEVLINNMPGIAISTGSACTSGFVEKSHVLSAIGLKDKELSGSFRIAIGKNNNIEEIQQASNYIIEAVKNLKSKN
jgi:cysteine desulfurase